MGKPTISGFIIGMVLVSMVMVGLSVLFSSFATTYARDDFSESDIKVFNKLDDLENTMSQTRAQLNSIQSDSLIVDIFGKFLTSGYAAIKITFSSVDTFQTIVDSGIDTIADAGALEGQNTDATSIVDVIKVTIITILSITIFIGVIIAAIFKWVL